MNVGKLVMEKASAHLTPVTLELGGKSPCIVDHTANIPLTARRLVFGKYLNCGQTCVAPDYVLVEKSVKEKLLTCIKEEIRRMFGEHPLENQDYGKMINQKHFDRVRGLIDPMKLVAGGQVQEETLRIAPTVLADVTAEDPVMQEEIFGPGFTGHTGKGYRGSHSVCAGTTETAGTLCIYRRQADRTTGTDGDLLWRRLHQ